MSRPVDQIVRDTLGNQAVTIVRLQAELEAAQDRVKELEAQLPKDEPKPQE